MRLRPDQGGPRGLRIDKVPVPEGSLAARAFARPDYGDAYRCVFASSRELTVEDACRAFFGSAPAWVSRLLAFRNRIVRRLGLKAPRAPDLGTPEERAARLRELTLQPGMTLGLFHIYAISPREVLAGEDDRHLDFRVSMHLEPAGEGATRVYALTLATVVRHRNVFGRLYFAVVGPFHRRVVPAVLRSMARRLG